jgi:hypothetical protein
MKIFDTAPTTKLGKIQINFACGQTATKFVRQEIQLNCTKGLDDS